MNRALAANPLKLGLNQDPIPKQQVLLVSISKLEKGKKSRGSYLHGCMFKYVKLQCKVKCKADLYGFRRILRNTAIHLDGLNLHCFNLNFSVCVLW
jgi:hypothetical protein